MKVLIACEESQVVCIEFRKLGFESFSCDIQDQSGGHPEWHLKEDIFKVIESESWDCMIAFPPCTHLAVSGAPHFEKKIKDGRQQQGINFFMDMVNANIKHIAIENPIGIMSKIYRKPNQIIQPYFFGDPFQKSTCLWLKNLPPLIHNDKPNLFEKEITHSNKNELEYFEWIDNKTGKNKRQPLWYYNAFINAKTKEERSRLRSKTFPAIAFAIPVQWGKYLMSI